MGGRDGAAVVSGEGRRGGACVTCGGGEGGCVSGGDRTSIGSRSGSELEAEVGKLSRMGSLVLLRVPKRS